ncbi:MAG: 2Fe-2S iron-sulfur cluster binding domain [Clostridiales bacterium]|jgi:carbon-monoxide dehydrogenase small subunit|nr:2Fe-2S iron-sulfur cluster binding domain [Clostridiales bacterium]
MGKIAIKVTVNGKKYDLEIDPRLRLIDLLRDELRLTGTKEGCGEGECGACTVLLNGAPVNSCLVMAFQADGKKVLTIEGLGSEEKMHPIQEEFLKQGAVQCGYCTPGMVLSAYSLLKKNPQPAREEIKKYLAGNLCRCTGYDKIIKAVESASQKGVSRDD